METMSLDENSHTPISLHLDMEAPYERATIDQAIEILDKTIKEAQDFKNDLLAYRDGSLAFCEECHGLFSPNDIRQIIEPDGCRTMLCSKCRAESTIVK